MAWWFKKRESAAMAEFMRELLPLLADTSRWKISNESTDRWSSFECVDRCIQISVRGQSVFLEAPWFEKITGESAEVVRRAVLRLALEAMCPLSPDDDEAAEQSAMLTEADVRRIVLEEFAGHGPKAGWSPGEAVVRSAIVAFVNDALTGPNCQAVIHEALVQLRDLAASLTVWLQSSSSHGIDSLSADFDTPAAGAIVAQRALALVGPLLQPPA